MQSNPIVEPDEEQNRERFVQSFIRFLKRKDISVRPEAMDYLMKIGESATEPLLQALSVGSDSVRTFAAFALGRLKSPLAVDNLIHSLKDSNEDVRTWAAWALGEIGDARSVEPLRQALSDESEYVRAAASSSIDQIMKTFSTGAFFIGMDLESNKRDSSSDMGSENQVQDVASVQGESKIGEDSIVVPPETIADTAESGIDRVPILTETVSAAMIESGEIPGDSGYTGEASEIPPNEPPSNSPASLIWEIQPPAMADTNSTASSFGNGDLECPMVQYTPIQSLENICGDTTNAPIDHAIANGRMLDIGTESPAVDSTPAPQCEKFEKEGAFYNSPTIPEDTMENPVALTAESSSHDMQPDPALSGAETPTHQELCNFLEEQSPELPEAPPTILEPLLHAFHHSDDDLREIAIHTLKDLNDPWILALFIQALQDRNKEVRWWSVWALGKFEGEAVLAPLILAMQDPDEEVRNLAESIFARIRTPEAVQSFIYAKRGADPTHASTVGSILVETLHNKSADLRAWAAWALGEEKDIATINSLIQVMQDASREVRMEAIHALESFGESAVLPLIQALHTEDTRLRVGIASCLLRIGEPSVDALIASMGDEDAEIRRLAAALLAILHESSVEPLIESLASPIDRIRAQATYTLEKIGKPAIWPLIHAMDSEQEKIRKAALELLVVIGEPAVDPLILSLENDCENIRAGAICVLGELKDARAVEAVIRKLRDPSERVRLEAAHALGKFGEPAIAPLRISLGGISASREQMADALLTLMRESAVEPLIKTINTGGDSDRATAAALFSLIFAHLFEKEGIKNL